MPDKQRAKNQHEKQKIQQKSECRQDIFLSP